MSNGMTSPERACGRAQAKKIIARIGANLCGVCNHAVHGWGKSACDTPGRTFPLCLKTPGTRFDPDFERLKGV